MDTHGSHRPAVTVADIVTYQTHSSKAIQRYAAAPPATPTMATELPVVATLDPSVAPMVLPEIDARRSNAMRTRG